MSSNLAEDRNRPVRHDTQAADYEASWQDAASRELDDVYPHDTIPAPPPDGAEGFEFDSE